MTSIYDFVDIINAQIVLRRHPNQGRWTTSIRDSEIKEEDLLVCEYGEGSSIEDALEDYINKIEGKVLVIDSMSDRRCEFNVPKHLCIKD